MKNSLFVAIILLCVTTGRAQEAAVEVSELERPEFRSFPLANSVHGWEFSPLKAITVTHLGLFDEHGDGLALEHQVGLFPAFGETPLTSGFMSPGIGDSLIEDFRYIDVPDVTLEPQGRYVIAYHTATDDSSGPVDVLADVYIGGTVEFHPLIDFLNNRWELGDFGLPSNIINDPPGPISNWVFGPSFLFVPEPTSLTTALIALVTVACRRRA